jgi:hypothetical protein
VTTKTGYLVNISRVDLSVFVIWNIFTVCLRPLERHECPLQARSEVFLLVLAGFEKCQVEGMYDILILQPGFRIVQCYSLGLTLYTRGACSTWFLLLQGQFVVYLL